MRLITFAQFFCASYCRKFVADSPRFFAMSSQVSHQSPQNLPLFAHHNQFLTSPHEKTAGGSQDFPRWPASLSLCEFKDKENPEYVLVVLNGPIGDDERFEKLFKNASLVVCADGGSNRLYDWAQDNREHFKPDLLLGDLDSARKEVRDFYEAKGTVVEKLEDQDYGDFEKSLMFLQEKQPCPLERLVVVAYGAFGGRFDQEMASMNVLQKVRPRMLCLHIDTPQSKFL